MSFGSNTVDWCVRFEKKSTFFAPRVARTALVVGFRTSFGDQNRNCENTPDMSFGSNRVDSVRSIRKNGLQLFSLQKWPERPSGSGFARVLVTGCVLLAKINCNFFRSISGQNAPWGRVSYKFWRPNPKLRKHNRPEYWEKW